MGWKWSRKVRKGDKYLNGTKDLKLMLIWSFGHYKMVCWNLYVIHNDCNWHTSTTLTLRSGAITSLSQKQKINGKSLTIAELIEVDEALPQILCNRYFIEVMVMIYWRKIEKWPTQKEPNMKRWDIFLSRIRWIKER